MGTPLFLGGALVYVIGEILMAVPAFRENVLWGIGCLLFPPVCLIFLILHWQETKNPFFVQFAGIAVIAVGAVTCP